MKKTFVPLLMFLGLLASDAAQASDTRPAPAEPSSSNEQLYLTTMADVRRLAEGVILGELSFQPERECRKPPKAPPDQLLKKRYSAKLQPTLAEQSDDIEKYIHRVDLNGDGICDWLREGGEWSRYDRGSIDGRNFLFLGTPDGWRYAGLTKEVRQRLEQSSQAAQSRNKGSVYRPPKSTSAGSPSTLTAFVFEKNNPKPYLVTYRAVEDRDPLIYLSTYTTYSWNNDRDNFYEVPRKQHAAILLFLHQELCGKVPVSIMPNRYTRRFSAPSYSGKTLCTKEESRSTK